MIYIEGADKLGKTTLANQLAARVLPKSIPVHFTKHPPKWDFFRDYVKHAGWNAVWDRGHYSELAYQRATGREERVTLGELRLVDGELFRYGCIYVVVTASTGLLQDRLKDKPDDKFDADTILAVNDWFKYDFTGPVDYRINCHELNQYPHKVDIDLILDMHQARVCVLKSKCRGL